MSPRRRRFLPVLLIVMCSALVRQSDLSSRCLGQELVITPLRLGGQFSDVNVAPLPGEMPQPTIIYSLQTPMISATGHILYTAGLTSEQLTGQFPLTHGSLWTTTVPNPTVSQLQVVGNSPAPMDDWMGTQGNFNAPNPVFQNRITGLGITNDGLVFFAAGRFGLSADEGGQNFSQDDEDIIWQAGAGVVLPFANFTEGTTIDFETMSDGGHTAMVRSLNNIDELVVNVDQIVAQSDVPSGGGAIFGSGFGLTGGYQFDANGDLYFQSPITGGAQGIYQAGVVGLQNVILEGGTYLRQDSSMATLNGLELPTANGYGLQVTSRGEVGFLGDQRILLGRPQTDPDVLVMEVVGPGFFSAEIDGTSKNIQLLAINDLFIAPDDTIYFEAEAEIRDPGPLFGMRNNYIWKVERDATSGDFGVPQTLLAEGQVAIDLDGPDDIQFGDEFTLKDANADGNLLLTAELDRSHANVNNSNNELLAVLNDNGELTVLAREDDPIPLLGGATYGVPIVARGAAMSENGDVVFRSNSVLSANPSETRTPAVLLATFTSDEIVDFVWSGACGNNNWHADCETSNWNDPNMAPAEVWPGDEDGTQNAFIGDKSVVISDLLVDLRSLRATGSLEINVPLRLREDSIAEDLLLKADLTIDKKLELSGTNNQWESGDLFGNAANVAAGFSKLAIEPGAKLTISGPQLTLETNIEVNGTIDHTASGLTLIGASTITVENTNAATYKMQMGGELNAAAGMFVNEGKFEVFGGTLTGGVMTEDGSTNGFHNRGGQVILDSRDSLITINGVLRNSSGNGSDGTIQQKNNVTLVGDAIVNESGGIYEIVSGDISRFVANRGTFHNRGGTLKKTGSGDAKVFADLRMTGGDLIVERGSLTLLSSDFPNSSDTFSGMGTISVNESATLQFANNTQFAGEYRIEGRGTVNIKKDLKSEGQLVTNLTGPGNFIIDNERFDIGVTEFQGLLTNTGNVEWRSGTLDSIQNSGTLDITGVMINRVTTTLSNSGIVNHDGSVDFFGPAPEIINSNTYNMRGFFGNGGTITNATTGTFRLLDSVGTRVIRGRLDNQGTIEVGQGSILDIRSDVTQLTPDALEGGRWIVHPNGEIVFRDRTQRIDVNRGTVILKGNGRLSVIPDAANAGDSHDFENAGVFELRESATFNSSRDFDNYGMLFVDGTSTLNVNGSFDTGETSFTMINGAVTVAIVYDNHGDFAGNGTINGFRFDNMGNLLSGQSPGRLTLDVVEFVQHSSGRIVAEVAGMAAGEQYDQIVIGGTAELSGTLELSFLESEGGGFFVPTDGAQFEFVTAAGGITGQFDQIITPSTGLGADVSVTYEDDGVMLTIMDTLLFGDYTGKGFVGQEDLDLVLLNWGEDGTTPPATWVDQLPEGLIDQSELDGVLLNWGNRIGPLVNNGLPEPRSNWLMLMAGVLWYIFNSLSHSFRRHAFTRKEMAE